MTLTAKLYLLIAVLFALDAAITLYALRKYPNQLGEANGLLRGFMAYVGRDGAMLLGKALAFGWVAFWKPGDLFLLLIAMLYALVVAWNLRLVLRAKR